MDVEAVPKQVGRHLLGEQLDAAVLQVLRSGQYIGGGVIAAFEQTEPLTVPRRRKLVDNLVEIIWQFSQFMQNTELGGVLPFVMLTTILIITVVKSSLALSLGLQQLRRQRWE